MRQYYHLMMMGVMPVFVITLYEFINLRISTVFFSNGLFPCRSLELERRVSSRVMAAMAS